MGDRANIVIKQSGGYLGVYLHGDGYRASILTAKAIDRVIKAGRQKDEGYATRIAVSSIIGENWNQDYSYGLYVGETIDLAMGENEYDIVTVIDFEGDRVHYYKYENNEVKEIKESYSLSKFVEFALG